MYRIIQISDLHIPENEELKFNINVRIQFDVLLENISKEQFDLLVISGDLAYREGIIEIYQYIQEKLTQINKPIVFMPGNHDDIGMMKKIFPIRSIDSTEIFHSNFADENEILYLDSSTNSLSEKQLSWLAEKVISIEKRIIIFIHHPILHSNVNYMDTNYFLKNRTDIQQILIDCQKSVHIFCGHYHTDMVVSEENITQYICPSNFYFINTQTDTFHIESIKTGYRIIDISKSSIYTRTVQIQGAEN